MLYLAWQYLIISRLYTLQKNERSAFIESLTFSNLSRSGLRPVDHSKYCYLIVNIFK